MLGRSALADVFRAKLRQHGPAFSGTERILLPAGESLEQLRKRRIDSLRRKLERRKLLCG